MNIDDTDCPRTDIPDIRSCDRDPEELPGVDAPNGLIVFDKLRCGGPPILYDSFGWSEPRFEPPDRVAKSR